MVETFKCVCGSLFTETEALEHHIKQFHMVVFENAKDDVSEILSKFKEAFPELSFQVTDGSGWYAKYRVSFTYKNAHLEQYIGNTKEEIVFPETIESAILDAKWKMETIDHIEAEVIKLGEFDFFYCDEFHHGYSIVESYFHFVFNVKGQEQSNSENFYPFNTFKNNVDEFVASFERYFVSVLEGTPEILDEHEGYFKEHGINGISIGNILSRGKRVRLEVLE